ncbi:dCTP deaminase [Lentilactobacillus raoultii]|uniref:dCTP deaminase n=1 Tax=Lentilactobacillus raoultii TaxID=1987503 RepID=A0ABW3PJV2_9LACO|nr:dCTP deaminase [Lentilactobacillus raoultii]
MTSTILSGRQIQDYQGKGLTISPFSAKQLNPNSYNLRLYPELMIYTDPILDMKKPPKTKRIQIPESGYLLSPNQLYLARTIERTTTTSFVPMLEGRSSVGRLGLSIHVTAGFGDVGFSGFWTLEMFCLKPVRIYGGVDICQIYYHTIDDIADTYINGKYSNNQGIQPSKLYLDFK